MYKSIVAPSNNRFSNIGTLMSDDESSLSSGSVKRPSNYKSMYLTKDLHNNTRSLNQYSELSSKRRYPESLNNSPQASVKSLSEEEHSLVRFSKINDNSDFEDSPEMLHAYRLQTMIDFQALKVSLLLSRVNFCLLITLIG